MVPYIYREIGGISDKEGKAIVVPEISSTGLVKMEELLHEAKAISNINETTLGYSMDAVAKALAYFLANGHSVELKGIGVLRPTLRMKSRDTESDSEKEEKIPVTEEDGEGNVVTHNAQNIEFGTVQFRPANGLIRTCRKECHPFHDTHVPNQRPMATPLSEEERRTILLAHLDENGLIHAKEYMELTGLRHTSAHNELKRFCREGILVHQGAGTHKFFTKR